MADRRRIERELHDGVQQHLVAVIVNLQLARELADADLEGAKAVLDELSADAAPGTRVGARAGTRALPLAPSRPRAGRGRPRRSGRVGRAGARRDGSDPGWGGCRCRRLRLLRRAHRQRRPSMPGTGARATVRLWQEDGAVRFEVADDGVGFDPARGAARRRACARRRPSWARSEARSRSIAVRAAGRGSPGASRSRRERLRVSPARRGT